MANVCSVCGNAITPAEAMRPGAKLCRRCREEDPDRSLSPVYRARREREARVRELARTFPQWTTMPQGDFETLGIVSGTAVMGADILSDVLAGITDVVGGRSGRYQQVIQEGKEICLGEMCEEAVALGAELVAGVRLDVEPMNNMLMVIATGTALRRVARE